MGTIFYKNIAYGGGSGGGNSYTEKIQTLTAGNTTVTFTDISSTATVDFYTDTYGVYPLETSYNSANSTLTLTFEEQETDVIVKVRIS